MLLTGILYLCATDAVGDLVYEDGDEEHQSGGGADAPVEDVALPRVAEG